MTPIPPHIQTYIDQLHALVDQLTAPVVRRHQGHLRCRQGCIGCCQDDLTVFAVEADAIARYAARVGLRHSPGKEGACAFLTPTGACAVYEARPYVCRTQGLPLRWGEQTEAGPVEHRDICPEHPMPLTALPAEACWTLGPVEQRLAEAQRQSQQAAGTATDTLQRFSLRELAAAICPEPG